MASNEILEGIESSVIRGRQDDLVSMSSEKKFSEEFYASLPAWLQQCERNDYEYDPNYRIASATFMLPNGELISVKRSWDVTYKTPDAIVASMHYRYWLKKDKRWAKADTLDHAIYCATEFTRSEIIEKAKLVLDAHEESA